MRDAHRHRQIVFIISKISPCVPISLDYKWIRSFAGWIENSMSSSTLHRAFVVGIALFALAWTSNNANAAKSNVSVTSKTKFYKITGRSAREFAHSMSKKGPYSFQHRRRAWATASRDLTYQLVHQKRGQSCRIKNAKVTVKITYTMPQLRSKRGVSSRELKKWRRMYGLLDKHEKTHGRFFGQLAHRSQKALMRLKPAKTCRKLEKNALVLMKKLSAEDSKKNDRFDARDGRNYSRMTRIYTGS